MIRRQFIKLAALSGATGIASLGALDALETRETHTAREATETKTVTWRVRGFTCVTCAVGLETMLRQQKGVSSARASYPDAEVTIQFDPGTVSEASLRIFITSIGFSTEEKKG
jgi:copper chaperone CopZ